MLKIRLTVLIVVSAFILSFSASAFAGLPPFYSGYRANGMGGACQGDVVVDRIVEK
ncbi:MAG: hypothetical protein FWG57_04975 [Endomicrobia bacterium]|nr:hypothetical protein [Endomicrobiia bacterium]